MRTPTQLALHWAEKGLLSDTIIRAGIRHLCRSRLRAIGAGDTAGVAHETRRFVEMMDEAPIALQTQTANAQHYEVPPTFFEKVLGTHMKYSACWWDEGVTELVQAEAAALRRSCEYADLQDGQDILELGCGWGSLTLWMAARYPRSRIVAVSNSAPQRLHIQHAAFIRGLHNVRVITSDMNAFTTDQRFDRIVSVEMFEHMRNWRALFSRIHQWLRPGGRFYLHVFCHRQVPYLFEARDDSDWMSRHFFSGGMMPSDDLALRVQHPLQLEQRWHWDGTHYARTAQAWLRNLDCHRDILPALLGQDLSRGACSPQVWTQRWRIFFMACTELFGYDQGRQWRVSHYRFARTEEAGPA